MNEFDAGLKSLNSLDPDNPFVADMRGRLTLDCGATNLMLENLGLAETQLLEAREILLTYFGEADSHGDIQDNFARCALTLGQCITRPNAAARP